MLSEGGCGKRRRARSAVEFDRTAEPAIAADQRVLHGRHHRFGEHLRIVEHVLDRPRRRARNVIAEVRFPLVRRAFMERLVQSRHDLGGVLRAFADHTSFAKAICEG